LAILALFTLLSIHVMHVYINKELTSFHNCFSVRSQLCLISNVSDDKILPTSYAFSGPRTLWYTVVLNWISL